MEERRERREERGERREERNMSGQSRADSSGLHFCKHGRVSPFSTINNSFASSI
jgi:hypothetical protein